MKSVFADLELDTIRYSLVWEDWDTLYNNLNINHADHIAIITSAGCNVLNAALKFPASITAIDLNPVQNKLLSLKLHIIQQYDFATWRNIMGFEGKSKVQEAWLQICKTLTSSDVEYWQPIIQKNNGLMVSGKLERYINGYFFSISPDLQNKIKALFEFDDIKEQYTYYQNLLLNDLEFFKSFSTYFSNENLSKGRDPRLFTYAEQKGGTTFFERLDNFLQHHLASQNFYLRFFFLGIENIPINILPPCHQPDNFKRLKECIHIIKLVNEEAVDYLLSKGKHINKASLSNIFEYISQDNFKENIQLLFSNNRTLRVLYWNLLQNQLPCEQNKNIIYKEVATEPASCFYFNNGIAVQSTVSQTT